MAKGSTRGRRRIASRQCRATPYPLPFGHQSEEMHENKCSKPFEKKDWENATCSVCMEYPHNAVLLLCSSHEKGCRPYMCGTSFRYSNCLDQYRKAYTKVMPSHNVQHVNDSLDSPAMGSVSSWALDKCEVSELACPLCRGQVKGWTVVEPAREYLNRKKRSCMQDNCSFVGTYKELRKHVKAEHPSAKPREVDPLHEQKWRRLERERERDDVISTITSSMPGAVVFGDYVIEGGHYGFVSSGDDSDDDVEETNGFEVGIDSNLARIENNLMNVFFFLQAFGSAGGGGGSNRGVGGNRRHDRGDPNLNLEGGGGAAGITRTSSSSVGNNFDLSDNSESDAENDASFVSRLRRLSPSGRRRRRREANNNNNNNRRRR